MVVCLAPGQDAGRQVGMAALGDTVQDGCTSEAPARPVTPSPSGSIPPRRPRAPLPSRTGAGMTGSFSLTPRQADVLRFIAGYLEATGGICPTQREIGEGTGITSRSHLSRSVAALEERGCIRRVPGKHQSMEVLVNVPIPRGPAGEPLHFVGAVRPSGLAPDGRASRKCRAHGGNA